MRKNAPRLTRRGFLLAMLLLVWGAAEQCQALELSVQNRASSQLWMSTNSGAVRWLLTAGMNTMDVAPGTYEFRIDLADSPVTLDLDDVADYGAQTVEANIAAGVLDVRLIDTHSTWQWYLYGFGFGFTVCGYGWIIRILRMARTNSTYDI